MPNSDISRRAAALSRSACPDFLFNHCMRTYVFGALWARQQNLLFNVEEAFVAAALHDLGLLPGYASVGGTFEIDGAQAGEAFGLQNGMDRTSGAVVWNAIALHDTRFPRHASNEALVVAVGAGVDVNGPGADFSVAQIAAVLAAFPRLQFKTKFTALLVDHCHRKPLSQAGTWLEGLCREVSPAAWPHDVVRDIAASNFVE